MISRSYWFGVAGGLLFTFAIGAFEQRAALVHGTDFSGYWAGGRALLLGADPYDAARWRDTVAAMGTQPPDTLVYGYTPWVAIAMAPLALLPLEVAAALWAVLGLVAASVGVAVLLRVCPCPAPARAAIGFLVAGSQPAQTAVIVGQWSPLLTGMTALAAAAIVSGRPRRAVAPLLAALAKPQLFLLTVPALLWRRWRAAATFAALALVIVIVATILMPDWYAAWTTYVPGQRLTDPPRAAVLGALLAELLGPSGALAAYAVLAACALAVAVRFGATSTAALASWLALSAVAAPYSWSYDWLLLVVPLVLGVSALAAAYPMRARLLALAGLALLTLVASLAYAIAITRGRETYSAIVPLAMFVTIAAFTWPLARSRR